MSASWCNGEAQPIIGRTLTQEDVDSTMLDVEATFCYLGDMLCSGRGCDSGIAARCCVVSGKFRKLLPVLTTRHLSLKICGKVYEACVCSAMLHSSKTWGPNSPELQRLHRYDCAMFRWICGTQDKRRDTLSFTTLSLLLKYSFSCTPVLTSSIDVVFVLSILTETWH